MEESEGSEMTKLRNTLLFGCIIAISGFLYLWAAAVTGQW